MTKMESSFQDLSLKDKPTLTTVTSPKPKKPSTATKTKALIVDSWEDATSDSDPEDASSDTETESDAIRTTKLSPPSDGTLESPGPPPPTPVSMTPASYPSWSQPIPQLDPHASRGRDEHGSVRPEKQTAVAGRLIAGALGVKPPRRTEEERRYDKTARENERKKRERKREEEAKAKEETEKAKAAVWNS